MSKSGGKQRGHMLSYGHPHVATWSNPMAASIRSTASSVQSNWFSLWGVSDASKPPDTETKSNVRESGRAADELNGLREFTATSNGSFRYVGAASYSTVGERIFVWAATCKWPGQEGSGRALIGDVCELFNSPFRKGSAQDDLLSKRA